MMLLSKRRTTDESGGGGASYPSLMLSDTPQFSGGKLVHGTATSPALALPAGPRTYEFLWTPSSTGPSVIFGAHGSGQHELLVLFSANNRPRWQFASAGDAAFDVTPGQEYHMELALDPAAGGGFGYRSFIDGSLFNGGAYPGATINPVLTIAAEGGIPVEAGGGFAGNGSIRNVRVSNVVRHPLSWGQSFTPPATLARDADTVVIWDLATDGTGR